MSRPAYAAVVLDVDSTISGIEGIDWLASRRGPEVAQTIATLTDEAMRGVIPLESVYSRRLAVIRPTRAEIEELSRIYIARMAPRCGDVVAELRLAGVRVVMVSGGLRQAIVPLAESLGIAPADLSAVDISFDGGGAYDGFDDRSPLTTQHGKADVLRALALPHPLIAVGDGSTDIAMRDVADTFGAFVGFARRENVVARADIVFESFDQLARAVLPE
jgi:phosphoserine phosphatase